MGATTCGPKDPDNFWSYCPSLPAAVIFASLFGLTTLAHIVQAWQYKKIFCWVIILGGMGETAAFVLRSLSVQNQLDQGLFQSQFVLILVTPLLMNAFDFVVLGRMVNYFMPDRSLIGINAKRIAVIFVCLDVLSFLIQLGGAGMSISTDSQTMVNGQRVYTAGVGLQQLFIIMFVGLSILFVRRLNRVGDPVDIRAGKTLLYFLYISLALITFRIIFRIVEFSGGNVTTTIENNEWFSYVFDSVPMLFALVVFNIKHPGTILTGPRSEFQKLSKEQKRQAKEARRFEKAERRRLRAEDKLRATSSTELELTV